MPQETKQKRRGREPIQCQIMQETKLFFTPRYIVYTFICCCVLSHGDFVIFSLTGLDSVYYVFCVFMDNLNVAFNPSL